MEEEVNSCREEVVKKRGGQWLRIIGFGGIERRRLQENTWTWVRGVLYLHNSLVLKYITCTA